MSITGLCHLSQPPQYVQVRDPWLAIHRSPLAVVVHVFCVRCQLFGTSALCLQSIGSIMMAIGVNTTDDGSIYYGMDTVACTAANNLTCRMTPATARLL